MSRSQAKGKRGQDGAISKEDMSRWIKRLNVSLRGADVDEAPQAYKRLHRVLEHHAETVRVLHTLTPLGVAMAGGDIRDPYKD
jgi:tRNA-splicing ligase RtcB